MDPLLSHESVFSLLSTIADLNAHNIFFLSDHSLRFELLSRAQWAVGNPAGLTSDGTPVYQQVHLTPKGKSILEKWLHIHTMSRSLQSHNLQLLRT